jgi:hypothetical protein
MISLLTPTRKRPERLLKMISSAASTAAVVPEIVCYVSDCDDSYDGMIEATSHLIRMVRGPRLVMSDLWNACLPHATGDIFMLCADDVIFRTPGWDVAIEGAFAEVPDKILLAFADDMGPNGKTFATLPFVHRRWVEAVGYFTGPGFSADFSDSWPFDVAKMINRLRYVDVQIEHAHHLWGKAPLDQTYEENKERYRRDRPDLRYVETLPERYRDSQKLLAAIERFKETQCHAV